MKLKFLSRRSLINNDITLSAGGQLRFKSQFSLDFELAKGDRLQVGIDDDEDSKNPKTIFLVKSKDEGFKIQNGSGQYFIQAKTALLDIAGFKSPIKFDYEPFEFEGMNGMKLTIKEMK